MAKTTISVSLGSGADDEATSGKISVRRVREGADGDMLVLSAWKDYPVGPGLELDVTAGELYESHESEPRGRTRYWYAPDEPTAYADLEDVFPLPPGETYGPQGVGVLNATQPEAGKVAFQLSDGSTTAAIDLPDGTGVTDITQPTPTTMALELSDGTTTDPITLPAGPGGSDAGVAGYVTTPGSATEVAVTAKIATLKAWAKDVDNLIAGAITYTSGLVSSAVVEWPDGKPGVLTITARQSGTDAVTNYNVTRVDGSTTTTYTQPTITRDVDGNATSVPQITVA